MTYSLQTAEATAPSTPKSKYQSGFSTSRKPRFWNSRRERIVKAFWKRTTPTWRF